MSVIDRDKGLKRIYAQAARFARTFRVGVSDPLAAEYADDLEGETGVVADAFDSHLTTMDRQLQDLHFLTVCTGVDPALIQTQMAEGLAGAIRENIDRFGLVDTGRFLESIGVERVEGDPE